MGVYLWTPIRQPGAYGYYTFDDQNANQITDISGNNRNLTGGTMPSYTLVSGSNYAGNYTNVSSGVAPSLSYSTLSGSYTMLVWVKATASSQSYVNCLHGNTSSSHFHQISLIWNYNSGKYEYYDSGKNNGTSFTYRTEILANVSLDGWHLIGYTHTYTNGTATIQVYGDGVAGNSINSVLTNISKRLYLGSSNTGDRFKGQIGECCIYGGIKTAEEVAEYYNGSKKNYGL